VARQQGRKLIEAVGRRPIMRGKTLCRDLALTVLLAQVCPAQLGQPETEPKTIESWLRGEMLNSSSETKLTLLTRLLNDYQKAGLVNWAYDQIAETTEPDQVECTLALGEKLMALDPKNIEIANRSLKLAEMKQDAALIQNWAEINARVADSILSSPETGETGKKRLEIARSMVTYIENLAYSEVLRTEDPAQKLARIEKFLERYKNSSYRTVLDDLYLEAANVSGGTQKALAAARKILEWDDRNVVALMVVAENYLRSGKEPGLLKESAEKILALVDRQPKPEGLTAPQWSKKKAVLVGRAHWMIGRASMQEDKYRDADNSLRAALPYLKGDNQMTSDALFYLAWANYQMRNFSDAMRFSTECTRIDGPYRAQAAKNLEVFRAETASKAQGSKPGIR
jgi:tetratricopeptide (TPR) repeat protein